MLIFQLLYKTHLIYDEVFQRLSEDSYLSFQVISFNLHYWVNFIDYCVLAKRFELSYPKPIRLIKGDAFTEHCR